MKEILKFLLGGSLIVFLILMTWGLFLGFDYKNFHMEKCIKMNGRYIQDSSTMDVYCVKDREILFSRQYHEAFDEFWYSGKIK